MRVSLVCCLAVFMGACATKQAPRAAPDAAGVDATATGESSRRAPRRDKRGLGASELESAPEPPPPPLDPLTLPEMDDGPLPPLSGRTDDLEMRTLTRIITTFTLEADMSGLDAVSGEQVDALRAHLAASPQWRLTRWHGTQMAFLRQRRPVLDDTKGPWTVGYGGYHRGEGSMWRAGVRLGSWAPDAPEVIGPMMATSDAASPTLVLPAWSLPGAEWAPFQAVAFTVEGAHLALHVHELAEQLELTQSSTVMARVPAFIQGVGRFAEPELPRPYIMALMPKGEPLTAVGAVGVRRLDAETVEVRGRPAPSAPGWTWARIIDRDGIPVDEALYARCTLERVGWSSQESAFLFQAQVPTTQPLPPGGRVELWFRPDDGETPTLVGSWALTPES